MARLLACLGLMAWILLLQPFPVTTFLGMCVACVSCPLYTKLQKRQGKWALPTYSLCLALIVILPITAIICLLTPQAVAGLRILDRLRDSQWWTNPQLQIWLAHLDTFLRKIPGLEDGLNQITTTAVGLVGTAVRTVLSSGMGLAGSAFQLLLNLTLFVMIAVLCVDNATIIRENVLRITAFPEAMMSRFIHTIRGAISAVLTGVIFVAIIQGILCGIGFAVAGVPQPAFWGMIAACVAPIPFVGTALVWLPICLWLWLTGSTMVSVGLVLWCTLIVTGVDNVLRPFFLKTGIDASVVTLILAIMCGLYAFGPAGIFAGPVLVAVGIQAGRESHLIGQVSESLQDSEE